MLTVFQRASNLCGDSFRISTCGDLVARIIEGTSREQDHEFHYQQYHVAT
jgi:hypothetical protein